MPYLGAQPDKGNFADLNGGKLILDADADTSITADTDDQIDIEIAGSDELKITATMIAPATADGSALGVTSNEWSHLYLADGGVINLGADQDVTITHDPDDGLFFKSTATADDNPFLLTLQTGETDLAANDVIGKIAFQAPDEGTGTDSILVSAAIQARAEGEHSSSSNATSIDFMTGASEAATTKVCITSAGAVDIYGGELILDADADTSIHASTDDQIDIKISGADDFQFTANTFTVLSGSTLTIASGATIANSGTATGFGGLIFISGATASNSATVAFTGISSTYETYVLTFNNVVPATDNVSFNMRTSTDGGSSYESGAGNYRYVDERGSQGGTGVTGSASATEIILVAAGSGVGSDTGEGFNGIAYLYHPSNTGLYTSISSHGHYQDGAADSMYYQSSGTRIAAADVDAIQFYFSSGNIESGEINLYGMVKA